jgi:hypothetical protein
LTPRLKDYRRRDTNTGQGKLGNLQVFQSLDGITVRGSIAKYLHGENMTPLNLEGVRKAIEKLETETGLHLGTAVLGSVEIGSTYILKQRPAEYLRLFGDPAIFTKAVYSKAGNIETVGYWTKAGSRKFCGYDKGKEMLDRREKIPPLFDGCNSLRLEYKITRRKGIKAKFGRVLSAYDLFDYDIYRKLQGLFLEAYKAIPKTGRQVYIDTSKPMTPAMMEKLTAEAYRQANQDEHKAALQAAREAGTLTEKSLERIRARDRRQSRDFTISDKNKLIAELDAHVYNSAMY